MKFQKQLAAIFQKLNFFEKAKTHQLTKEEWDQIFASYKEEYGNDLKDDLQEAQQNQAANEEHQQILTLLRDVKLTDTSDQGNGSSEDPQGNLVEMVTNLVKNYKELETKIEQMAPQATPDTPLETIQSGLSINGPGQSKTHFLGIEHSLFDLKHRWNQAVKAFSNSLAERYNYLKENNMLNPEKLASGEFGFDTSRLPDAKLGDQYMIRRQDALIARMLTLREVTDLFPVRYGVQDREMITNAFFTEVSQAWQKGKIFKGSMKLVPEFGHVDDAMAKVEFGTMKEIERLYIGYLNTDGSDPIKWSMIEFALLNLYKNMQNEQNKRRVMGIYVKPEEGKPGSYLNASTGLIYTLVRYYHENKFLLHDDPSYRTYDKTDMLDAVKEFVDDIQSNLTEDHNLSGKCIYLNLNHKTWWIKNLREQYRNDTDFSDPQGFENKIPDTDIPIKWVPNLGQLKWMMMQTPGNIMFLEFIAGEMFSVKIKEDMEEVKAWSTWKEGTSASFVGPTFRTKEELRENAYELQEIFMNKPAEAIPADATFVTIDPKRSFWFTTSENTQPTVLEELKKARKGFAYIIECGSTVNATEVKKAGQFDGITADWTPTQEEDYIMVTLNSAGKFVELERQVGGVREINIALQPNIPGAR
ncbi:MAG: hypothetical protein LIP08_06435 [Bacteroides sp.]|nr:hypothetical protein [Bacteroides sp.]